MRVALPVETDVLWGCLATGDERYPAGRRYWWDNRSREGSAVVVQASIEGEIELHEGGRVHASPAGTLLVIFYGDDTQYGQPSPLETPYRCAWAQLKGAGMVEHLRAVTRLAGPVLPDEPGRPLTEELQSLRVLARRGRDDADAPLAVAAATQRFVMSLYESAVRRRRRGLTPVERAVERLLQQPTAPESVEQVAGRFGVSREHLSRVFRERIGRSPARYVADARVQRAVRLLRGTDLSVAEIAEQVGMGSAAALSRQVRRVTGRPPSGVRRNQGVRSGPVWFPAAPPSQGRAGQG